MPSSHRRTVRHNTSAANRPDIDTDFSINTIWTVETIIETALLADGTLFLDRDEEVFIPNPHHPRNVPARFAVGHYEALGRTRAHKSLYYPLEGLRDVYDGWSSKIGAWAMRAKYMREHTLPSLERRQQQTMNRTEAAEYVSMVRSFLHRNGTIDQSYVNNFKTWARLLKDGLKDMYDGHAVLPNLCNLADMLQSICDEGNPRTIGLAATASAKGDETRLFARHDTTLHQPSIDSPSRAKEDHKSNQLDIGHVNSGNYKNQRTSLNISSFIPTRTSSKKIMPLADSNAIDLTLSPSSSSPPQPSRAVMTDINTNNIRNNQSTTIHTLESAQVSPSKKSRQLDTTRLASHLQQKQQPSSPQPQLPLSPPPLPPTQPQPQWYLALLSTHRHPQSRPLHIHPNDERVYVRASYLANEALARLKLLIKEIEGYATLAEDMRIEYGIWSRKAARLEKELGNAYGRGRANSLSDWGSV